MESLTDAASSSVPVPAQVPVGAAPSRVAGGGSSPRRAAPRPPRGSGPPAPDTNKLIVTGYPPYTQSQDILRIFSKIGNVKIDHVHQKCSILTFPTPAETAAALKLGQTKSIYGFFLIVKPYDKKILLEEGKQSTKKEYKKNKQKVATIDPTKLDLSGDFHQQLDSTLGAVRLTQEHVAALSRLYVDVELVLQALWPGCTAIPFGSITTGLGIKSSDADCFVNIPSHFRNPNGNYVTKAKRLLQQHPKFFSEILSIPRANTPIVKFYHIPTETYCDLTFKTPLGAQNSKLIAFLLHSDPRLIPMAVFIKYWAKVHDISGTGKLTNYALTMMILFYLQQPHVAILPSVLWLQRDSANTFIVDYWNTGFMCQKELFPPTKNRSSISELLGGFFEYYSTFKFDEFIVCPYLGFPIKKVAFKDMYGLPQEFDMYRGNVVQGNVMPLRYNTAVCVQDPFEQSHNVASAITDRLASDIKEFFKFAANAYQKEKTNNCEKFLKIILIQKPKLIRNKNSPEYRVHLYPRMIAAIDDPDWKEVVREIIFTMFEKMMRIKLEKMETKVNPDSVKEKLKYTGSVTKAIWKRKQFEKLYAHMNINFQEKQERITDEILKVDRNESKVQFTLSVIFSNEPRSVLLAIRVVSEEAERYKEFGRFFLSVMQRWFSSLLSDQCKDGSDLQGSDSKDCQDSEGDSPSSGEASKECEEKEASPTTPSPTNERDDSSPSTPGTN